MQTTCYTIRNIISKAGRPSDASTVTTNRKIDDDDDLTLEESTTTAATPINDTNNTDLPPEFDPENLMLLIGSKLPGGTRRTISAVSDQETVV